MELGPKQKQWLEDLPKFKKTKGVLCRRDSFCCLGVYLHTQNDEPWGLSEFDKSRREYGVQTPDGFINTGSLPDYEATNLGLRDVSGAFAKPISVKGKEYTSLVDLNDSGPFRTHAEMAKFIREHKDEIFTRSA